jgi:hypothetical protein
VPFRVSATTFVREALRGTALCEVTPQASFIILSRPRTSHKAAFFLCGARGPAGGGGMGGRGCWKGNQSVPVEISTGNCVRTEQCSVGRFSFLRAYLPPRASPPPPSPRCLQPLHRRRIFYWRCGCWGWLLFVGGGTGTASHWDSLHVFGGTALGHGYHHGHAQQAQLLPPFPRRRRSRSSWIWSGPRPGGLTLRLRDSRATEVRGWSSLALAALADFFYSN